MIDFFSIVPTLCFELPVLRISCQSVSLWSDWILTVNHVMLGFGEHRLIHLLCVVL